MEDKHTSTPVALFIFNRPHTTARVFEEIRRARPARLLVVADGPRGGHASDQELCAAAREVVEQVDWDCKVDKNYADENLGCKQRMSSGLNWVFDMVEEAVLLEDDTLPHPSFFRFCRELLAKYRQDQRIMMICGTSFLSGKEARPIYSYYFSRHVHCWGWASWRRAWQFYDVNMSGWPEFRDGHRLPDIPGTNSDAALWRAIFEEAYQGRINTWDYQWVFTCLTRQGLSVMPYVNLVSNIGFGPDATHTINPDARLANFPATAMRFSLNHPPLLFRDMEADDAIRKFCHE